jgi:type I restriction enzyme, S subunit
VSWPWVIPEAWQWRYIGEVAAVIGGGTPDTRNPEYFGGDIPWITPADLSGYKAKHIESGARSITQTGLESSGAQLLPTGSVLFSSRAPIGYVAIAANPLCTNQGFKSFILDAGLESNYIYYYLQHAKPLATKLGSGTTFLEISGKSAAQIPVPIAPRAEQARIAETLDELLSDLDAAVATLERTQEKLKLYRASVLKAAIEGTLTAEWRAQHPHVEPASELLQRILAERRRRWEENELAKFTAKGKQPPKNWKAKYKEPAAPGTTGLPSLPRGWCWVTLNHLLGEPIINGLSIRGSDSPPGVAALRLSAMSDGAFDYSERRYLPAEPVDVDDLWIRAGDFFVSRGNGSKHLVGRGTSAQEPPGPVIFPDTMMRLRFIAAPLSRSWVPTIWGCAAVRRHIERVAKTTAGIWKISQPDLAGMPIPVPPLEEQESIVETVEDQVSVIDHLETELNTKLKGAQALRQAILRQAFTGQLVPQDPNDEPASELLKRIAAERESRVSEATAAKRAAKKTSPLPPGRRGRPRNHEAKEV